MNNIAAKAPSDDLFCPEKMRKSSILRIIAGYAGAAAAVPYIILKIIWLSGGTVGLIDPQYFDEQGFLIGNAVSLGMDVLAIILFLMLTHHWGEKIPAKLILFPVWTATGLLLPIIFIMIFSPFVASEIATSENHLQAWVFTVVYGGFAAQGIFLLTGFILYAQRRWTAEIKSFGQFNESWKTNYALKRTFISLGLLLVLTNIVLRLSWLCGITKAGLATGAANLPDGAFYLSNIVYLAFDLTAAAGAFHLLLTMKKGIAALPTFILIWIGAGALFGWGIWEAFIAFGNPDFGTLASRIVSLTKIIAAILIIAPVVIAAAKSKSRTFG